VAPSIVCDSARLVNQAADIACVGRHVRSRSAYLFQSRGHAERGAFAAAGWLNEHQELLSVTLIIKSLTAVTSPYFLVMWSNVTLVIRESSLQAWGAVQKIQAG
jgi:hypothetical protein